MVQLNELNRVMSKMAIVAIISMCIVGAVNAQIEPDIQQNKQTTNTPLIVIEGKSISSKGIFISPEYIKSITVLKDQSAVEKYGEKGKNGVVIVATKPNLSDKLDAPLIIIEGKDAENISSEGIAVLSESIASIEVLKDDKMYGGKSRNGVVIITAKKEQYR